MPNGLINDRIFLNWFADVKFATIKNFASVEAKTAEGSLLQSSIRFDHLEKDGYLRKFEYYRMPSDKRNQVFYYPTLKAYTMIGREKEYKYKTWKAPSTIQHDSMVVDFVVQLVRHFTNYNRNGFNTGWKIDVKYTPDIYGKQPDAFINMFHPQGKYFYIWLELEKKERLNKEVANKIRIFQSVKSKLPPNTKCVIVLGGVECAFILPQAHEADHNRMQVEMVNRDFNKFIKGYKRADNSILFMKCFDYHRPDKAIFHNGPSPMKLI